MVVDDRPTRRPRSARVSSCQALISRNGVSNEKRFQRVHHGHGSGLPVQWCGHTLQFSRCRARGPVPTFTTAERPNLSRKIPLPIRVRVVLTGWPPDERPIGVLLDWQAGRRLLLQLTCSGATVRVICTTAVPIIYAQPFAFSMSSLETDYTPRILWRLQRGEHVMEARLMPHAQYVAFVILVDRQLCAARRSSLLGRSWENTMPKSRATIPAGISRADRRASPERTEPRGARP